VRRGDIVALRPPRTARGHGQQGQRYGVVLQAEELLGLSTVIVAPTSTGALAASFRPEIEVRGKPTRLLVDQLRAVDRTRLGRPAGTLSQRELERVDDALAVVVGLV
jgi:mRNA interferase MazF